MALAAVLEKVRRRWGQGSIVRLDGEEAPGDAGGIDGAGAGTTRRPAPNPSRRLKELPRWWPTADPLIGLSTFEQDVGQGVGHDTDHHIPGKRPRVLELVGEVGGGRLSVALAWTAAARPALAAVVDPAHPAGWFYAPAAAAAGIDLERLVVVRPPEDAPRAVLDAAVVLLRSEAFDVVLCPLPADAWVSTTFAGMLATLAARTGTTLFLLASPQAHGLGAAAEYRVRLGRRRWLWENGEIAGVQIRAATERARAGAGAEIGGADALPPEYELTLRLLRRARYGPPAPAGARAPTRSHLPAGTRDCFYLDGSTRLLAPAGHSALPVAEDVAT